MKTIEELLAQEPVYSDLFDSLEIIAYNFEIPISDLDEINILFACYSYEDFSGSAFVLFEKDGKLYVVYGSHCSCFGLEGQWDPEETFLESLKVQLSNGGDGGCHEDDALRKFLGLTED